MKAFFLCFLFPLAVLGQVNLSGNVTVTGNVTIPPAPPPILSANLLMDLNTLIPSSLITDPSGNYVTNWLDTSGNGNNAVQYVTNFAMQKHIDSEGRLCLRSFSSILNGWTNYMTVGNGLSLNSQNATVYIVSTGPHERGGGCIWMFGGAYDSFVFLGFSEFNTYTDPITMRAPLWNATAIYPALNPAVFCSMNSTTNSILRWNNEEAANSAAGSGTLTGGEIGGPRTGSGNVWGGDLYRIIVYGVPHWPTERQYMINALSQLHNIHTNFSNRIVCRGDSTTEGFLITNLMTWPFQCYESRPTNQWFNYGVGSARIQTNGSSGNVLYGSDPTFVDPVFSTSIATNWLFVMAGVNDLNLDTQPGQNVYGRLTNYCAARLAAKNWKIVVGTIANNSSSPAEDTNYCNAIRGQYQGYWFGVADLGANSPVETRLNDYANTTYFADQLHLTQTGYGVVKQWFMTFLP